jgi:DNA-binding protein HU-beta
MAKTVTKADLVDAIAKASGCTKKCAAASLEGLLSAIEAALAKGNVVQITGFGTFDTAKRKARTARNPRTGETIKIPATVVPRFRPGAGLKAKVKK